MPFPHCKLPRRSWLSNVKALITWTIMFLAVGYLWRVGVFSRKNLTFSKDWWWALPAAEVFISLTVALVSLRFHCLLLRLGCPSSLQEQLKINSSALLAMQIGSEAGYDVVRIVGTRTMGGKNEDILAALMTDRLLGIVALTGIAAVGLALYWNDTGWVEPTLLLIALLCIALAIFPLCRWFEEWYPHSRIVKIRGFSFLSTTGASILRYRRYPVMLGTLLLTTIVSHFCWFMALYCCSVSLTGISLSLREAVLGGALSTFTSALPLPLAGLGMGEVAFGGAIVHMRRAGEVASFSPTLLINRLLVLLLGVLGWAWMTLSGKKGAAQ